MQKETDEVTRQYGLAAVLDTLGRHEEADRAAGNIASVYACRNDLDNAFAWIDRAYRQHDSWLTSIKLEPCTRHLLPDPRYHALLGKLNLPV